MAGRAAKRPIFFQFTRFPKGKCVVFLTFLCNISATSTTFNNSNRNFQFTTFRISIYKPWFKLQFQFTFQTSNLQLQVFNLPAKGRNFNLPVYSIDNNISIYQQALAFQFTTIIEISIYQQSGISIYLDQWNFNFPTSSCISITAIEISIYQQTVNWNLSSR